MAEEQLECTHHWAIAPATSPTSMGTCRYCGLQREFYNYVEHKGFRAGWLSSSTSALGKTVYPEVEDDHYAGL